MFASTVNLLLSGAGSRGADVLRLLLEVPDTTFMSRFVQARAEVAQQWIRTNPHDFAALRSLTATDIDEIYGAATVQRLAERLSIEPQEIVRLLNGALFTGARLVAPDGDRVSERAVKRLDAELRNAIL